MSPDVTEMSRLCPGHVTDVAEIGHSVTEMSHKMSRDGSRMSATPKYVSPRCRRRSPRCRKDVTRCPGDVTSCYQGVNTRHSQINTLTHTAGWGASQQPSTSTARQAACGSACASHAPGRLNGASPIHKLYSSNGGKCSTIAPSHASNINQWQPMLGAGCVHIIEHTWTQDGAT